MLLDIKPRIQQPRTASAIDWSHPFTRALRFAYTVDEARPYRDLVRGRNGTPSSGVSVVTAPYGTGLGLGGVADNLDFGNGGIPNEGGSISVFARLKAKAITGEFGSSGGGVTAPAGALFHWRMNAITAIHFFLNGVGSYNSTITSVNGHWTDIGIAYTYGGPTRFFIRDLATGIIQFQTIAGAFVPIVAAGGCYIGANYGGSNGLNSPVSLTYFWDRALTDQEFLALSFEPYAFVVRNLPLGGHNIYHRRAIPAMRVPNVFIQ